jgi:hypothetical protein
MRLLCLIATVASAAAFALLRSLRLGKIDEA